MQINHQDKRRATAKANKHDTQFSGVTERWISSLNVSLDNRTRNSFNINSEPLHKPAQRRFIRLLGEGQVWKQKSPAWFCLTVGTARRGSHRAIESQRSSCFVTGGGKGSVWILFLYLFFFQTPENTNKQVFPTPLVKSMVSPLCLAQKHHCQVKGTWVRRAHRREKRTCLGKEKPGIGKRKNQSEKD